MVKKSNISYFDSNFIQINVENAIKRIAIISSLPTPYIFHRRILPYNPMVGSYDRIQHVIIYGLGLSPVLLKYVLCLNKRKKNIECKVHQLSHLEHVVLIPEICTIFAKSQY